MALFLTKRWPLWAKLSAGLFLVTLVVSLFSGIIVRQLESKYLMAQMRLYNHRAFNMLQATSLDALITEDIPILESITKQAASHDSSIISLNITNEDGNKLVEWNKVENTENENLLTFSENIIFEGEKFGAMTIAWDVSGLQKGIENHVFAIRMIIIAVLAVLTLIILLWVNLSIIDRLKNLMHGVRKMGQGRLDTQVPVNTTDEIGQLSSSINKMAADLQQTTVSKDKANRLAKIANERAKEMARINTELKKTQAMLVQAEKLTAIGQLGAGVAHELNQPLTAIRGFTQLILEEIAPDNPFVDDLQKIECQTQRMAQIIDNIRTFARTSQAEMEAIDIREPITAAFMLFDNELRLKNITATQQYKDVLPKVMANSNQLQQVFINLISNSCDAMEESDNPRIDIVASNGTNAESAMQVKITFKNNGPPIPEKVIDRIFEPFFSTKEIGKGTGLGLSIVYGIIKDHKGHIQVTNLDKHGVQFQLTLPAVT